MASDGRCLFARIMAASVTLSKQAGQIARQVRLSNALQTIEKEKNDFQTAADRESQKLIIGSLNKHFPGLKCIGEEDNVTYDGQEFKEVDLDSEALNAAYPATLESLDESKIIAWVDPLDGTKEYTEGGEWLEHVTVLIGFSVDGTPVGGVIHQPFYQYTTNEKTEGRTLWGVVGLGVFGLAEKEARLGVGSDSSLPLYCTTRSHSSPVVNECMEALQPCNVARLGGSGNKVLAVIDGRVDAYVYPSLGLKKWDSCAPEAIIKAAGGYFTDIQGKPYTYTGNEERMNWMGDLAGFGDVGELVSKIPPSIVSQVEETMQKKIAARKK